MECGDALRRRRAPPVQQHVLVVYRPLAAPVGLQLVVRVPLGDVGGGVPWRQRPPPHGLAPAERSGGGRRGIGRPPAAGLRRRAGSGAGAGEAGGPGRRPAAVSHAGLRAPPVERERDEEGAGQLA
ncbi:hypothetical protein EYF80_030655 [Liparis tanakae]|uniref:Uncharacterized protein n=1 Tax=Liparis tanakae TaxID=230148 RepID=A0A4Z2H0J5_9TELE|nr:hypothetical protein EYF80_030655 [Liparis tanakae]